MVPKPKVVKPILPGNAPSVQDQEVDPSKPADTTYQEDLTHAGQRRINLIWEYTQSAIALMVVISSVLIASIQAVSSSPNKEFPVILTSLTSLVIGFYFGRTNHTAIGGVGPRPTIRSGDPQQYKGR